jgi:hypothetical protein
MSPDALKGMEFAVNQGMNLFADHKHDLFNTAGGGTLGAITKAEIRGDRLWIQCRLEDPEVNPLIKQLLHKMEIGEKVGLSIGGDMTAHHFEPAMELGKQVRVIDGVNLYEISAVGLPSNAGSYAFGTVFKALGSEIENDRPVDLAEGSTPSFMKERIRKSWDQRR